MDHSRINQLPPLPPSPTSSGKTPRLEDTPCSPGGALSHVTVSNLFDSPTSTASMRNTPLTATDITSIVTGQPVTGQPATDQPETGTRPNLRIRIPGKQGLNASIVSIPAPTVTTPSLASRIFPSVDDTINPLLQTTTLPPVDPTAIAKPDDKVQTPSIITVNTTTDPVTSDPLSDPTTPPVTDDQKESNCFISTAKKVWNFMISLLCCIFCCQCIDAEIEAVKKARQQEIEDDKEAKAEAIQQDNIAQQTASTEHDAIRV
ncbi:MAG: hypothetical protein HY860_01850 [Chlamydiales bacterium]|nr:hypothetical protein [Chlamydiales bacterium]